MRDDGDRGFRSTIEQLTDVIDVAVELAETLSGDPTVQRVIEAFRVMPFEDRQVIAGVLEREVQARRISAATQRTTGQAMHPNPNARLYVRSHEKVAPSRSVERDEMMLQMLAALRVIPLLLASDVHDAWLDATRIALGHLEPTMRRAAAVLLREVVALAEEADAPTAAQAVRAS
jgi:hypothetical protein